jgi:hypothetical protein
VGVDAPRRELPCADDVVGGIRDESWCGHLPMVPTAAMTMATHR